jgi:hypothetical protein
MHSLLTRFSKRTIAGRYAEVSSEEAVLEQEFSKESRATQEISVGNRGGILGTPGRSQSVSRSFESGWGCSQGGWLTCGAC